MMPGDARPVIKSLQRQVNVLIRFQFDNRQSAFASHRQNVNHRAVRGRERGYLRIAPARIELIIQGANIFDHERLQPALGMQSPPTALARSFSVTNFADAPNEPLEMRKVVAVENPLTGSGSKHNFRSAAEIPRLCRQSGSGKLQAMTTKRSFCRRQNSNFHFRH